MLFAVMWTVIDAFTRIVSDILYVNSHIGPFKKYLTVIKNTPINILYYGLVLVIVFVSMALLPLKQPLTLLTISAVLGGLTMAVYTPVLMYLNNFRLPKALRPSWFTNLMMFLTAIFYAFFAVRVIAGYF